MQWITSGKEASWCLMDDLDSDDFYSEAAAAAF
jgi:hypothetical protein